MLSTQLLSELETLPYSARQKRLTELGRDPANAALFDELERGATSYERRLALQSCATSRDGERVVRLLFDSSRLVRGAALRLLPIAASDEQIARVIPQLALKFVRRLFIRVRKHGRQDTVDAIINACLESRPSSDLPDLLPLASLELARQLLETDFERASENDFGRLSFWHPELALEYALQLARGLSAPDGVVLKKANKVLDAAYAFRTPHQRELALELVRELNRHYPLAQLQLNSLFLSGNAQELAAMVVASGEVVNLTWSARVRRIEEKTLVALVHSQGRINWDWQQVLKRVPLATRTALYTEFNASWRGKFGVIPVSVLELLPRDLRQAEARRHLQIPDLKATPANWLPYVALLPFDEASENARSFLGDPDPIFRAESLAALVQNARYERANIGAVLELLQKRANEQDPVRMAMLGALAQLPPSIFAEEHLPALAAIQRQALNARDLSYGTAAQLERLVVGLLPLFPEWASVQIAELLKERGNVSFFDLQNRINDAQMCAIGPRLLPLFRAWALREHSPFLGAMRALGRRLKVWDEGAQLLVNYVKSAPAYHVAAVADILAKFRGDLWTQVAPELLAGDESWALQSVMTKFLNMKRQDLLTPAILGRRRLNGRFASGRTRQVLAVTTGFWRWTPTQQGLFAQTLDEVLHDTSRDSPGAFFAIDRLCQLPDVVPAILLEQAQLSNPQPAWREAALRVLSRLDGGQGVPTLLESLDDERARIAIYGLRRALLEMPAARALEILRVVPLQKVTVAKEVMRLLGDLDLPEAFDYLLEMGARDLHRDVRVALLRALWEHLEDQRSWPILEAAATSPDPAVATMAARTTHPRLSSNSRIRLNAILAQLLQHPDSRVRLQVLQNGAMGAISDPQNQLLEPLLACLDSKVETEYTTAASAIWRTYAKIRSDVIARRAIESAIERLLPRRRALSTVLKTYEWDAALSRGHSLKAARLVLETLERDEAVLTLRLDFAFAVLPATEFAEIIEALAAQNKIHEGALFSLINTIAGVYGTTASWQHVFDLWRHASSPLLRRLALAILVSSASDSKGWTPERRAALVEFRSDVAPLVSSAAQFTFWPGEGSEEEDV
ncbi:hypothetical protein IAD21_04662 [Abditibacteriota bacterium]|nr:hypothetical protein IAD21_04662 [Abditibacteriota bacterium]